MAKITIQKGWAATGKLRLSDGDYTEATRREIIIWTIDSGSNVKSISNIYVKNPSPINIIWQELPHRIGSSDNWKAVIHPSSKIRSEYNYSIFWVPTEGTDPDPSNPIKHYDPKIAVKPDKSFFTVMVIAMASIFTAIFSVILFNKRRNSK